MKGERVRLESNYKTKRKRGVEMGFVAAAPLFLRKVLLLSFFCIAPNLNVCEFKELWIIICTHTFPTLFPIAVHSFVST